MRSLRTLREGGDVMVPQVSQCAPHACGEFTERLLTLAAAGQGAPHACGEFTSSGSRRPACPNTRPVCAESSLEPLAVLVRRADGGFTVSSVPDEVARKYGLAEDDRTPWSGWPIVRDRVSEDGGLTVADTGDQLADRIRLAHRSPSAWHRLYMNNWADKEGRGG